MKKIFTTFLVFFFSIVSVFAETSVSIKTNKKEYNIDDPITLNINLETDNPGENELSISGLDNFEIISKRQSQSRKIVNGISSTQFGLQLSLLAKKSGDYTLGPISVKTASGTVSSNTQKIKVTGERIMVNNTLNQIQQQKKQSNSTDSEEEDENIDDIDLTPPPQSSPLQEEEVIPRKIIGVDGKEMKDIYRKKGFLYGSLFSKNSLLFLIFSILGIILYYIFRQYIFPLTQTVEKVEKKPKQKAPINYKELLEHLEKKYIDTPKEVFYAQVTKLLRTYLDDTVQDGLSKGSLQQVEKFLQNTSLEDKEKILNFYKKIYFPEYAPGEDNKKNRKNILEELENIIITKEFK